MLNKLPTDPQQLSRRLSTGTAARLTNRSRLRDHFSVQMTEAFASAVFVKVPLSELEGALERAAQKAEEAEEPTTAGDGDGEPPAPT